MFAAPVWIDQQNRSEERARAPLVFLCASALESTRLLLLSRSRQSPDGLGAASGALGRYLMDHVMVSARGWGRPLSQTASSAPGRCLYLSRFDARELSSPRPGRGFSVQLYQTPAGAERSHFSAGSFAEMLPRPENRITLDPKLRDAWGIQVLRIECAYGDNEFVRAREQVTALQELAELAGVTLTCDQQRACAARPCHSRNRHRADGKRSGELGARPPQPVLVCARALRDRWR